MGGCQNYIPVLDPYYNTAPNTDHNFDNHPYIWAPTLEARTEGPIVPPLD